jgi:hypothetical protein
MNERICIATGREIDVDNGEMSDVLKVVLVDMETGEVMSNIINVFLNDIVTDDKQSEELIAALRTALPDIVFPFHQRLVLPKPKPAMLSENVVQL